MSVLLVRDLMSESVHTLPPEANLAEVSDLMSRRRIRHVPIVDEERRVRGLVSQQDLLRGALGGGADLPASIQRAYLRSIPVQDVLVADVRCVGPDVPAAEAARLMLNWKIGSLLVVEGARLVGIVTENDFVRWVGTNC